MDERRDPGEFYPGGRVIGREGVTPGQVSVRWRDIVGKPDFSDVATLSDEATRGEMKQIMNTVINKLKTSVLIGALLVVGSSLADVEPLFAKADDIPGNQQIMTNVQEYVDAKVAAISNDVCNIVTNEVLYGWHLEEKDHLSAWCVPQSVAKFTISNLTWNGSTVSYVGNGTHYSFDAGAIDFEELCRDVDVCVYGASSYSSSIPIGSDPSEWTRLIIGTRGGFDGIAEKQFSAISYNKLGLARLVDLPTKTSQIKNDSGFVTASITNDLPSRADIEAGWWSEWKVVPQSEGSDPVHLAFSSIVGWTVTGESGMEYSSPKGDIDSSRLNWTAEEDASSSFTATRHRVAGPVPTKPADIGAASPGTVSNIVTKAYVEDLGIKGGGSELEDPVRHCTWQQCVTNGVFYWIVKEEP